MKNLLILITLSCLIFTSSVDAQNLDSTTYTLIGPNLSATTGITESTSYSALSSGNPMDDFTVSSSTYTARGTSQPFFEAFVPELICLETSTTSGTTNCTGIPGSDGMRGVCSSPGCYNRAKIEINVSGNPDDVKYALQISTDSNFASNVYYVSGITKLLKTDLELTDFLYKCEWEGTVSAGYCGSPNTTLQKYNILGLNPSTTYYVRASSFQGVDESEIFSQSDWGPSLSVATQATSITFDIDVASSTAGSSTPPYIISNLQILPESIYTTTDYIVFRVTSNALNGAEVQIKGENGELENAATADVISAFTGDLAGTANGYGVRNDSATNSQINSGYLGDITVAASPIDFTDVGATHKVGGPTTSFVKLFDSNSLPIFTGVSAYKVKVKADFSKRPGSYQERLVILPFGIY